jgi:hypothetical protein
MKLQFCTNNMERWVKGLYADWYTVTMPGMCNRTEDQPLFRRNTLIDTHGVQIRKWIESNCKGNVFIFPLSENNMLFEYKDDALRFKLTWAGVK